MHTITIGGYNKRRPAEERVFTFPGEWSECTPLQLGMVVALLNMPMPNTDDEEVLNDMHAMRRLQLLFDLCGMPASITKNITNAYSFVFAVRDAAGNEHGEVLPQLDWAFTEMRWARTLVPHLVERVQLRNRKGRTSGWTDLKWIGPDDGLVNFSVKRWGYADACLQKVAQTGGHEALNNLLGALYVPEGEKWNAQDIEARGRRLSGLPQALKLAALANYKAIRLWLPTKYPNAFEGGAEDPNGVHGLIVDLAGPKFGKTSEAEEAPLHDVLIYVQKAKADAAQRDGKILVPEGFDNKFKGEA